jgi:hypothetical protein
LFLIGRAGTAFPRQNQRRLNTHFTRYLIGMKLLFVALGLNVITSCLYDGWNVLSAVAIQRNMGAGHANLPLCKSQQGSSPQGEGESFSVCLKIRATEFAGQSPAKPESASGHFLSRGERIKGEGGRKTKISFPIIAPRLCVFASLR